VSILFSPTFAALVADDPLVYVDAGARDGLQWPWRALGPEVLRVIAFEPDAAECEELNRTASEGVEFIPAALWSDEGTVELHIASVPSCSSVHPPNDLVLAHFDERHRLPRRTVRTLAVPCTTLDRVLAERGLACDFAKIDTQGSELEILRGASASFSRALGAVLETWTVEVHAGQALTGAVLEELAARGLQVFDVGIAAAWSRASNASNKLAGKRQVTGLDVLALRDLATAGADVSRVRLAKAAALADTFGFTDFAVDLLEVDQTDPLLQQLRREAIAGARDGRARRVRRLLGRRRRRAVLHG
jgi:FkbM family methyltransferase